MSKFHFNRKHGHFGTSTYWSWSHMLQRCNNPSNKSYARYGGRGITVCARWAKFENFLADMGEKPAGTSLDRINNSKGYSPSNCRWATPKVQSNNQRSNRKITFGGETLNHGQWAERLGLTRETLKSRFARGWSVERALTAPKVWRGAGRPKVNSVGRSNDE